MHFLHLWRKLYLSGYICDSRDGSDNSASVKPTLAYTWRTRLRVKVRVKVRVRVGVDQ